MSEIKKLLREAKFEIEQLRRRNEILSAKVEVLDLVKSLQAQNQNGACTMRYSADICHQIEVTINNIEADERLVREEELRQEKKAKKKSK